MTVADDLTATLEGLSLGSLKSTAQAVKRIPGTALKPEVLLVDSPVLLLECVDDLVGATEIAVDLEGVNLCREGTLSLLQLYGKGSKICYVVDVTVLGSSAFSAPVGTTNNLRKILESSSIRKLFYDCRNDCDALYAHYSGIVPQAVYDVQLQELAFRSITGGNTRLLNGLKRTMETFPSGTNSREAMAIKSAGLNLFAPERGGSYEVFNKRPLAGEILAYAAQDVVLLFAISEKIGARSQESKILRFSSARVTEIQSRNYIPNGRHKALAPTNWARG